MAVGWLTRASDSAVAVGRRAFAGGTASTAVGNLSFTFHANSTALGTGATATRANQQMFGTAANTYTTPGITSAASTAAQGAIHGVVTTDASGNLASDGGALQTQANTNTNAIAALQGTATNLQTGIDRNAANIRDNAEGIALALAIGGGLALPAGKTFGISGNWGSFDGENAMGFGAVGRLSKNVFFNGGFGYGTGRGKVGGRAGMMFTW